MMTIVGKFRIAIKIVASLVQAWFRAVKSPYLRRYALRGSLSFAELSLIHASLNGVPGRVSSELPERKGHRNRVRPSLVRFVCLGGDESVSINKRGIILVGAWITGTIDFDGCEIVVPIRLDSCVIDGDVRLYDAKIAHLNLSGSTVRSVLAERLNCSSSVFLRKGFRAKGVVRLNSSSIGGDLELMGATIDGIALNGGKRDALYCPSLRVAGSIYAWGSTKSLVVKGRVYLLGMVVGGDLNFARCTFESDKLVLTRAELGRLLFCGVEGSIGRIVLRGAKVDSLIDDLESWSVAERLVLDGFEYKKILDFGADVGGGYQKFTSPVDAVSRIRWLKMQDAADLEVDFKPQPWEHLVTILVGMGHEDDAREIAIAKQEQKRRAWWVQSGLHSAGYAKRARLVWGACIHAIYGRLSKYGYRPGFLIGWSIAFWLAFAVWFDFAADSGVMVPSDTKILASQDYDECRLNRWVSCRSLVGRYPSFNPVMYSFDLILPVVAAQHARDWIPQVRRPDGSFWLLGFLVWASSRIENILGWVLGLMFIAVVSGLIKKD